MSSDGEEHGSFEETPFSHLLLRALEQSWTGALAIETDAAQVIRLERGSCTGVLVHDDFARLGELLSDRGIVPAADIGLVLESDSRPLGQALLRRGLLDESTLDRALVLQLVTRLVRLFSLSGGARYSFLPGDSRFDSMPQGTRVDTLRVVWAGLEAHGASEARIEAELANLADTPLVLRNDAKLDRFGFHGEALAVSMFVRAEQPLFTALCAAGIAAPALCRTVVYLLAITRMLEGDARPFPVSEAPSPPPAAPAGKSPTRSGTRVARVQLKRVAVSEPVALPAIDSEASAWPEPVAPDLTLSDASAQQEPASCRAPRELHEAALYELSERRVDEALRLCELASQAAPENCNYRAAAVWIRSHLPRPDLKVLTLELDDILLIDPDQLAARFYRGVLRGRLGSDAAAKQDFERVLVLDPTHAAAQRELTVLAEKRPR